jgi:hypothetical protein
MTDQAGGDLSVANLLGGNRRGGLARTLIVDIALPWLAVTLLERWGVPMVEAFVAAALIPLASVAVSWFEARRIEAVGAIVAATLLLGAGLALVSSDVRFSVVKAAPAYFAFGVACLLSLLTRRPLMFFVARYFSAGGDVEKRAEFDARLAIPGFVRAMRLLTLVWGLTAVIEASCGIAMAITLPPRLALVAEPALALSTLIALLFWTVAYSRRQIRRGAP